MSKTPCPGPHPGAAGRFVLNNGQLTQQPNPTAASTKPAKPPAKPAPEPEGTTNADA